MFFREVLNEDLGCASYLVADGGRAAVVDPKWEIRDYLEIAAENGFTISDIIETHNHADHVSGRGRLAEATGATIHISKDAGVEYDHEPLSDEDEVEVGAARIAVVATPGHRPEHVSLLVRDTSRSEEPWLLLTGDSLFVGDLARPDLAVEAEEGAHGLFHSLRRIEDLEDFVEVRPAHIGGSLCGGPGMSQKPDSTIGFERRFNPYLRIESESDFVDTLTAEQAPQPPNLERIVELNRGPLLTEAAQVDPLLPRRVEELSRDTRSGAVVIDGRDQREFDAAHVPGAINVTMNQSGVGTRAAWVIDPGAEVITVADGDEEALKMARMLEAVGFRSVRGYLAGGIITWRASGLETWSTPALNVAELAEHLKNGEVTLLDVRSEAEWKSGHVEGSINVPYQSLRDEVPQEIKNADKPLAVACSGGIRSATAASLLKRAGIEGMEHVADGGVNGLPEAGVELKR
ncbi:MBL fold metallo-hydrolase [Rubrobacter aplysinae]|uniref:MBL fold metallo-hydrolase n=1 Tax=Rubrobacter aplysinae TaxID=909625 RepID=UPI00064C3D33|nr:MBL fold metallo-hydrolase [Rubrobacter aplysinae]